jgi:SOS response regulatory protein OraA/RecX
MSGLTLKVHPFIARLFTKGFPSIQRKWWWRWKKWVKVRCIAHGLAAIDGGEERDRLQVAIAKRWERSQEADPYLRKGKLVRYFVGKGFAAEEVEWLLNELQQVG